MTNPEHIRSAILGELNRRGWTVYKLIKEMGDAGKRRQSALYGWLRAKNRHVTDETAAIALSALELNITSYNSF